MNLVNRTILSSYVITYSYAYLLMRHNNTLKITIILCLTNYIIS